MTRESTQKGRFRCVVESLRLVVTLLLMMVVGVVEVKAQAVTEGLYYLGSHGYNKNNTTENYYLCPTEPNSDWNWYYTSTSPYYTSTPNGQLFMTTYQCRNGVYDSKKALWVVKDAGDGYFHIIHVVDGKYLTYNDAMGNSSNKGRMRLHLQTTADGDNALFKITYVEATKSYDITTKNSGPDNTNRKYLNVTGNAGAGNQNSLIAVNTKTDGPKVNNKQINVGGIIGLWTSGSSSDINSKWYPESTLLTAPTISDVDESTGTITIADANELPAGYTIRYTTDGTDPTATTGTIYSGPIEVSVSCTVNAVVVRFDVVLTGMASKAVSPAVEAPVVTNNGDGTISLSTATPNAVMYYTLDDSTPNNTGNGTPYTEPFNLGNATVIKAIAYNSTGLSSAVTTYNVPQYTTPTISFSNVTSKVTITSDGTVYYNTGDGSQADPTTSITPYSAPFDVTSPTTVKAIATHLGYFTSEVATLAITQVATPTFSVNSDNSITITCSTTGASIYYTTGDTNPDANSTPYTEPVTLPNGTTIKAIAVKENCINSEIVSFTSLAPIMISYDAANNKVVIINAPAGSTIYYTTGTTESDTPDPSGSEKTEYTYGNTGFDLPDNVDYIRAIAIKGSDMTSEVNLAIVVHASTSGNDRPYYIQSVQCTDFYMIPGDKASNVVYINTSSLGRASMEWCFYGAGKDNGVDYYYIKNKATNEYVCYYNSSSVRLHTTATFEGATDKAIYKFSIHYASTTDPGYYIHPKGDATAGNGLSKKNGNNTADVFILQDATVADNKSARWNLIRSTAATKPSVTPPFIVWGEGSEYKYYKIKKDDNKFIIPRSEAIPYPTVSVVSDIENGELWYFDEAYSDDWVKYYYIVNAATGEYLYFNGLTTKSANDYAFAMKEELGTDVERYQFALAKTTTTTSKGEYYILPRPLQNITKNNYSLLGWDSTNPLSTMAQRADAKGKWTFEVSDVSVICTPPTLSLGTDGKVRMSSRTRGSAISYKLDDADYIAFDSSNPIITTLTEGTQMAIATKTTIGGTTVDKTMTVVYKPTIELESVVYNGQKQSPNISSVKIGETTLDINDHCVASSDDVDASTSANAVITQKGSDTDYLIYGTAQFTIEQSPLTIYADSKTVEYGDEIGGLTFSTSGLATIDDVEVNLSCSATASDEMGLYPITFNNVANTDPAAKYTIKRHDGGADASSNYKDITLVASSLTITGKTLGNGLQTAEGITASLEQNGESFSVSVMRGTDNLTINTDYAVDGPNTVGKDQVWTIEGKGNYTGSAKVGRAAPTFGKQESDTEWTAGYVASNDWAIPQNSGIHAWIPTAVNSSANYTLVKEIDYLPAGVPVVLTANNSDAFTVLPKSDETTDITNAQKSSNLLKVVTDEGGKQVGDAEVYLIYKGEFVLAFAGDLPQGEIYMPRTVNSGNSAPARLSIVKDEDITGITEISEDKKTRNINEFWYTLDGRRLNGKPTQKGLYIHQGRKIVIK